MARSRDALFAKTSDFLVRRAARPACGRDGVAGERARSPHARRPPSAFPSAAGLVRDIGPWACAWRSAPPSARSPWSNGRSPTASPRRELDGLARGFPPPRSAQGLVLGRSLPDPGERAQLHLLRGAAAGAPKAHICVVEVDREGNASKP
jgi:hypothetical protein